MMRQIGDFPLWGVVAGLLPAVVCYWLGIGYAGSFLVFLGVIGVIAILTQLDNIEKELQRIGGRSSGGSNN